MGTRSTPQTTELQRVDKDCVSEISINDERRLVGRFGGRTAAGIGDGSVWGPRPKEDGGNAERAEGATEELHSPIITVITQARGEEGERRRWIEELRRSLG